nr:uncharacterized protein LOC109158743 [Ipomoea batatas]
MLPNQSENQKLAETSAEEADLLRRSTKKSKRGARERDDETRQMEEDGQDNTVADTMNLAEEQTAEKQPETTEATEGEDAPASSDEPTVETTKGPRWKVGDERAQNQGSNQPLGDKYGSWMIAQRKPRNYQNDSDPRRNYTNNTGKRNHNTKGKEGGNQGKSINQLSKEGFTIWNNSRYGALENLEEENEEEAQDEDSTRDRTEGPSGAALSGKGKRPQVQITEAQILNDNSATNRAAELGKQKETRTRQGNKQTDKNKRQINQAAGTEGHTVVRGFGKGTWVEKTVINEEGSTTETFQFQAEAGDHHQDPPEMDNSMDPGEEEDPMVDAMLSEDQTSAGLGVTEQ